MTEWPKPRCWPITEGNISVTDAEKIDLLLELGKIMLHGMERVDTTNKFCGPGIVNTFQSHFPMPDGREWAIAIQLHQKSDQPSQ